jgi:hypothetical protein
VAAVAAAAVSSTRTAGHKRGAVATSPSKDPSPCQHPPLQREMGSGGSLGWRRLPGDGDNGGGGGGGHRRSLVRNALPPDRQSEAIDPIPFEAGDTTAEGKSYRPGLGTKHRRRRTSRERRWKQPTDNPWSSGAGSTKAVSVSRPGGADPVPRPGGADRVGSVSTSTASQGWREQTRRNPAGSTNRVTDADAGVGPGRYC